MRQATKVSLALISALAALIWCSSALAAGGTTYDLRAKLDFDAGELNVSQKVVYVNKTCASLSSIVFNVSPAHFKAFKLQSAKVGGQDADWRLDDVSLEIALPGSVHPGEFVEIELLFDLKVPTVGGRFGVYDHVMALGNWYPVVEVYREGWNKHQYTPFGDPFFTEVADYEVVIESLTNLEIAHTGTLVRREGNTWHFRAERVRDFALAVSDRYEAKSVDIDGIKITAFNQPGHSAGGALFLDATAQAVRWLNRNLGKYPYESLHVAEINPGKENFVGQEYPNLVFISAAYAGKPEGPKSYAAYLIGHEIVHQWFYGLVGNDQIKEPWIDESLATYLAYRILEWNPLSASSPSVTPSGRSPVDSTVNDFKDETQYSATAYGKGTVFLQELAPMMKGKSIEEALREFVDLFKYKTATTRDFLSVMQSRTTTNLNPLISRFFSGPEYKTDSPLKLEVEWPQGDNWTGVVQIGFTSDSQIRRIEVSADGVVIVKADGPSTPLEVDISNLVDGDYVLGVTASDDKGRIARAIRRITVSGGLPIRPAKIELKPTPTPMTAQSAGGTGTGVALPALPFNVQLPDLPDYGSALGTSVNIDAGRILVGASALGSLVVLLVLLMAVQSRRPRKNSYQLYRPKSSKHAGMKSGLPKNESVLEVRPIVRPSPHAVVESAPPTNHPLSVSPVRETVPPQGRETVVIETATPKPVPQMRTIPGPPGADDSRGKGRARGCSVEGFLRREPGESVADGATDTTS